MTQPDRPAGRGLALAPSPVKGGGGARAIRIVQPASLREAHSQVELESFRADVIVVAAYGLILPQPVLEFPRCGAVNIHASLLPRWRGATPIQRALLAGDPETGISIMQMDSGLDTGPVLIQEKIPILEDDTTGTLRDRLAGPGAKLLLPALDGLGAGGGRGAPPTAEGGTYAAQIRKGGTRVDRRGKA